MTAAHAHYIESNSQIHVCTRAQAHTQYVPNIS